MCADSSIPPSSTFYTPLHISLSPPVSLASTSAFKHGFAPHPFRTPLYRSRYVRWPRPTSGPSGAKSARQTVLAVHRSKLKGKMVFFFVVTVISHCFLNHPCFHVAYLSLYMFGTGWLRGSTDGHCFIPKISSSSGLG